MANETNETKLVLLAIGKAAPHAVLFRNNTGTGWTGSKILHDIKAGQRITTIFDSRPLDAGLCKGSSDLIGWTPVTITPDMVGTTIAAFTAVEVKTKTGKISDAQTNFINVIKAAGGKAGIVRTPEQGVDVIIK